MNPFLSHEGLGFESLRASHRDLRTNFWEITVPASLAPMRKSRQLETAAVGACAGIGKGVAGHAAARSDRSRPGLRVR
jgi:hypothetical protein